MTRGREQTKGSGPARKAKEISPKQQRFVDEYLIDLNATQAAIRAGYSPKTAGSQAFDLLKKPEIQHAVDDRRKKMAEATGITPEKVLNRWWAIANADPNDLISYRRVCCRRCFGRDHGYQWIDEAEFKRAVKRAKEVAEESGAKPVLPSNAGGYGFAKTLPPHPKCPECHGEGHGEVFAKDTRELGEDGRALYAGVKITKEGLEIKMKDQDKALENVARHLGMFNDKLTLKGDPENPLVALLQQVSGSSLPVKRENDGE